MLLLQVSFEREAFTTVELRYTVLYGSVKCTTLFTRCVVYNAIQYDSASHGTCDTL